MMTCQDCCEMIDRLIDERRLDEKTPELSEHLRACAACASYAASGAMLDAELRSLTLPEPTPELMASLSAIAIPEPTPELIAPFTAIPITELEAELSIHVSSWMKDLLPGAAVLLPCVVVWVIAQFLPPTIQFLIQSVFTAAGAAAMFAALLRPRMLSH
jgi:anti-sigma factor RsiW